MVLLSGARNEKNSRRAQEIYDRMKQLFPQSKDLITSGSTLLQNIYGSLGDMDKVAEIRMEFQQSGFRKKTGLSWTVVNGRRYVSIEFSDCFFHKT